VSDLNFTCTRARLILLLSVVQVRALWLVDHFIRWAILLRLTGSAQGIHLVLRCRSIIAKRGFTRRESPLASCKWWCGSVLLLLTTLMIITRSQSSLQVIGIAQGWVLCCTKHGLLTRDLGSLCYHTLSHTISWSHLSPVVLTRGWSTRTIFRGHEGRSWLPIIGFSRTSSLVARLTTLVRRWWHLLHILLLINRRFSINLSSLLIDTSFFEILWLHKLRTVHSLLLRRNVGSFLSTFHGIWRWNITSCLDLSRLIWNILLLLCQ
jgi:hypothetical protein